MVRWQLICRPKKKGGLGVKDIEKFNLSLLCKWWWNLESKEGLWQEIVKKKYKVENGIRKIKFTARDSPCWYDLLKIRDIYLQGRRMQVKNGRQTDFWNDGWTGNGTLREQFGGLYEICQEQTISVRKMADRNWDLNFRRWLTANQMIQLNRLRRMLLPVEMNDEGEDTPIWVWNNKKKFTVKSVYNHWFDMYLDRSFKHCGKPRFP